MLTRNNSRNIVSPLVSINLKSAMNPTGDLDSNGKKQTTPIADLLSRGKLLPSTNLGLRKEASSKDNHNFNDQFESMLGGSGPNKFGGADGLDMD
jgi:hypothetical protein